MLFVLTGCNSKGWPKRWMHNSYGSHVTGYRDPCASEHCDDWRSFTNWQSPSGWWNKRKDNCGKK